MGDGGQEGESESLIGPNSLYTLFTLVMQFSSLAVAGEASPKVFYMRGCAKKPVFGLT